MVLVTPMTRFSDPVRVIGRTNRIFCRFPWCAQRSAGLCARKEKEKQKDNREVIAGLPSAVACCLACSPYLSVFLSVSLRCLGARGHPTQRVHHLDDNNKHNLDLNHNHNKTQEGQTQTQTEAIRPKQTTKTKTMATTSLKNAQLAAVGRMLAFNEDIENDEDYKLPPAGSSHNQWKILIYDAQCRSIISPLLNVSQLRRRGVTLHLMLQSDREPIPDVPAVYFVSPTKENVAIIAQDCAKGLYGRAHLNFVTKLDRELMEDFARLVVQSGSLESVSSVHDQYLDFMCMENRLAFCWPFFLVSGVV